MSVIPLFGDLHGEYSPNLMSPIRLKMPHSSHVEYGVPLVIRSGNEGISANREVFP